MSIPKIACMGSCYFVMLWIKQGENMFKFSTLHPLFIAIGLIIVSWLTDIFIIKQGFLSTVSILFAIKFLALFLLIRGKTKKPILMALGLSITCYFVDILLYFFVLVPLLNGITNIPLLSVLAREGVFTIAFITGMESVIVCLIFPLLSKIRVFVYLVIANILSIAILPLLPVIGRLLESMFHA